MPKRIYYTNRSLALAVVIASGLGALGWIWWGTTRRNDINFLPTMAPAEWIVYPAAAVGTIHPRLDLPCVFAGSLELKTVPPRAELRIAGFHQYSLLINGAPSGAPLRAGRSWKQPDVFEVVSSLRAGTNIVEVTVYNSNGPPALWLSLDAGTARLITGEDWAASYAGAVGRSASFAMRPRPIVPGNSLFGGDRVADGLRRRWPLLLVLAGISIFGYVLSEKWKLRAGVVAPGTNGDGVREGVLVLALTGAWVALFANNLGALPKFAGFDVAEHLDYVGYLLAHHSLPTASQGWEMFQPPLYYLLCATWLKLAGLTTSANSYSLALRILGSGIGLAHLWIVWKCLQCVFPGESPRRRWGLLLAGALPPLLYLSQYVSNEMLAATLVSASVYLTLRALQRPATWGQSAALGACLGAALLAKSSAVLALLPIVGSLTWKWIEESVGGASNEVPAVVRRRQAWQSFGRMGVMLGVCALFCGWHYGRAWLRYGNPFIGVWDPRTGFFWWQDDGYRTSSFYLRFGQALVQPWFSALGSFWDGIYATLWGDGGLGGAVDYLACPPWNYELVAVGYWLALVPTVAVLVGGVAALRGFLRNPRPEWFLLLGLGFLAAFAVVQMSLTAPYYCTVKAFYGMAALVPFCAIGGWGFDTLMRRSGRWRWFMGVFAGLWALNVGASFWVERHSMATLLIQARSLEREDRAAEAEAMLRARLAQGKGDGDLHEVLAKVLVLQGKSEEALTEAKLAIEATPDDAGKHLILALILGLQHTPEALAHARRAVQLYPGYAPAYAPLTVLLLSDQQFGEAVREARNGLANDPFNAELHLALATGLLQFGQIDEGRSQLQMAANLPTTTEVQTRIAALQQALKQSPETVAAKPAH